MEKKKEKKVSWMQSIWCKFQCGWNWIVSKLMFKVDSCPNKLCTCKK